SSRLLLSARTCAGVLLGRDAQDALSGGGVAIWQNGRPYPAWSAPLYDLVVSPSALAPVSPPGSRPCSPPSDSGVTTPVAVKIRLKRLGKIRAPYYRVVVADSRTKRDGRAIEEVGHYSPTEEP